MVPPGLYRPGAQWRSGRAQSSPFGGGLGLLQNTASRSTVRRRNRRLDRFKKMDSSFYQSHPRPFSFLTPQGAFLQRRPIRDGKNPISICVCRPGDHRNRPAWQALARQDPLAQQLLPSILLGGLLARSLHYPPTHPRNYRNTLGGVKRNKTTGRQRPEIGRNGNDRKSELGIRNSGETATAEVRKLYRCLFSSGFRFPSSEFSAAGGLSSLSGSEWLDSDF
jgi:hypothetical protein